MRSTGYDSLAELLSGLDASEIPELPALTFYRGSERAGARTYGELLSSVSAVASELREAHGVRPGDRILVISPNSLEIPAIVLAVMGLGAVVVPLNPTSELQDWEYVARHSGSRGVIGSGSLVDQLHERVPSLDFALRVEDLGKSASSSPVPWHRATETDLAVVLYTSGTTGNPKGVGLSQRNLLRNAWSMALNFALDRTTQFAVLPLYHAHALGFGLMTALSTQGHLVFTDKLDPFAWTRILKDESVRFTSVVPTLLPLLLSARVHRDKVPSLQAILVSSAPLSVELARKFEATTAIPLVQGWGLSEYTNFACCLSPTDEAPLHRDLLLSSDPPSIGPPLTGTEVGVFDDEGRALAEGERGELCVRGHSRMLGYFNDPDATARALRPVPDSKGDPWLRTGDQGMYRILPSGKRVFYVTGRLKEIIIRNGEKHAPQAIERRIVEQVPEIDGCFIVLAFPHDAFGEEIGAYLQIETLDESLQKRIEAAIESLPMEMRPKVLLHGRTPIPKTHTGKLQRRKLQPFFEEFRNVRGRLKLAALA